MQKTKCKKSIWNAFGERFAHKKHALDQEIAAGHLIGHPEHRQGRVILPNGTPLRADGTVGRR